MPAIFRLIGSWALVMAAAAGAIAAVDRLPALLLGSAHGARVYDGVEDAERALGARLWVPAYFPDTLAWPPAQIQAIAGPPVVVALHLSGRDGAPDALVVCQSLKQPAGRFVDLLSPGQAITSAHVTVGGRQARLERVLTQGGRMVHDLTWVLGDRLVLLRYAGPVEQLLLMANSLGGSR